MNGTSSIRFTALVNGQSLPVAHLTQDRVVLSGLTPGVNPFAPYRIGDLVPMTLVAERSGQREAKEVQARLDDLFAGEAHFGLPYGLDAATAPAMGATPVVPVVPGIPVAPVAPVMQGIPVAPAVPVMPMAGAPTMTASPYTPGVGIVSTDLDKTDREELMRQQIAPVQTAAYYTPTTGLVPTSTLPTAVAPQALPEDDRSTGSVAGRLAGWVLGGLFLLVLLALLLWQRTGIQSVQASLRGTTTEVSATSEGVLQNLPTVGAPVPATYRLQIASADGGTVEELRAAVQDKQALVDQTTEMLEQARAIANDRNNFVRTYGGGDGGTSTRTIVVGGGSSGRGGSSGSSTISSSPAEIEAARARVEAAQVRLSEAQSEVGRAQRLVDGGAMTRGELESMRANVAAREADLRAREAELRAEQTPRVRTHNTSGRGSTGGTETRTVTTSRGGSGARSYYDAAGQMSARMRVLDLERDLARMQGELRTAQARLVALEGGTASASAGATPIPQGAVVTSVLRPAGSYVRPGDPIMTVEGGGTPSVVAYFPFREARLIKPGATAMVSMPSIGESVPATVTTLGHDAVSASERYRVANENQLVPVRLTMNRVPAGAKPGTQADVTVNVGIGTIFKGRLYH